MVKKIIAAFKTHFDYGYTDLAMNVLQHYCTDMLDNALDICEKSKQYGSSLVYRWTLPAYLLMKMYERADAKQKERIYAFVQNDQIFCHALPFTMHTPLLNERLLEEMFMYTDEYVKVFDKPFPISAKMTDVPGHSSAIIKPLTKRGVRFLHLGKNPASIKPNVPEIFWWEDLEGNRILTMYSLDYGSAIKPPQGWKYPVWLAMLHTRDNVGVQDINFILESKSAVPKGTEFVTGTLDDFAREILCCELEDLPIVRGEIGDTWIHGVGSYPDAISVFRRSLNEFSQIEENLSPKVKKEFYSNALNYCEHTFGINILKYFGQDRIYDKESFKNMRKMDKYYQLAEQSWSEQRQYAFNMQKICRRENTNSLFKLTSIDETEKELNIFPHKNSVEIILPDGQKISLCYEYIVFGTDDIHKFMKKYLVRYYDWSISDFGKWDYPERIRETFKAETQQVKKIKSGYEIVLKTSQKSIVRYGNYTKLKIFLIYKKNGLDIHIKTGNKSATPLAEAGNFSIDLHRAGSEFFVMQSGQEINIDKDIVKNANHCLWAMGDYARIDQTKLYSIDAPLVSFGGNAIYEFEGCPSKKHKAVFTINLFNNQWGTNFPQWIEGSMEYSFRLE